VLCCAVLCSQGERQLASIADHMEEMWEAEEEAARHAAFVHAVPWMERAAGGWQVCSLCSCADSYQLPGCLLAAPTEISSLCTAASAAAPLPFSNCPAGMFEPPPPDRFAVATLAGLVLNNLSTLLFMANYTAVLPPTDALCVRIGVPSSYTGCACMTPQGPLSRHVACWQHWPCRRRLRISLAALHISFSPVLCICICPMPCSNLPSHVAPALCLPAFLPCCLPVPHPSCSCSLIMAASDLAAIFASVGISFWTQRSFKGPLLFSASACLAGVCVCACVRACVCWIL
jgi:hypothetical protein